MSASTNSHHHQLANQEAEQSKDRNEGNAAKGKPTVPTIQTSPPFRQAFDPSATTTTDADPILEENDLSNVMDQVDAMHIARQNRPPTPPRPPLPVLLAEAMNDKMPSPPDKPIGRWLKQQQQQEGPSGQNDTTTSNGNAANQAIDPSASRLSIAHTANMASLSALAANPPPAAEDGELEDSIPLPAASSAPTSRRRVVGSRYYIPNIQAGHKRIVAFYRNEFGNRQIKDIPSLEKFVKWAQSSAGRTKKRQPNGTQSTKTSTPRSSWRIDTERLSKAEDEDFQSEIRDTTSAEYQS
ncbi:MAG: hypothetical protein Q9220_007314 [cf. Caloplaca sp. 1 TL-2023]